MGHARFRKNGMRVIGDDQFEKNCSTVGDLVGQANYRMGGVLVIVNEQFKKLFYSRRNDEDSG